MLMRADMPSVLSMLTTGNHSEITEDRQELNAVDPQVSSGARKYMNHTRTGKTG